MESLACGTPVITFRTGGSGEMLAPSCGVVVERGDAEAMLQEILRIAEDKPFTKDACLEQAKNFDAVTRYREYVALYKKE